MSDIEATEEARAAAVNAVADATSPPLCENDRENDREMPCPMCGGAMPDLKGGKSSICPNCGFKDSCCY